MTENFCIECGGTLKMKGGEGRVFTYRKGSDYTLSSEFLMPTCSDCGEVFVDTSVEKAAKKKLQPLFLKDQEHHIGTLVDRIKSRVNVSLRDIEKACGVTPTYLSHVMKGRKEASEVLIGLLEGFAIHPQEVSRRLQRKSAHDTKLVCDAVEAVQADQWNMSRSSMKAFSINLKWDGDVAFSPVAANDWKAA